MPYRLTKRAAEARQRQLEAMRRGKDEARRRRPAPDAPPELPDLRLRITVERFDVAPPSSHVFELRSTRRVDTYAVWVDGTPWRRAGLTAVLEGIRKACPRMMSPRRLLP
jgi:hypothetical protein